MMFIKAHAPRLDPVRLDQLELCCALVQVAETSALIFSELDIWMSQEHLANEPPSLNMQNLATFIRGLNEPLRAIDIHRRRGSAERTEKPTRKQQLQLLA